MRIFLITGGAGFIGHHVVEHILKSNNEDRVVVLDKLSYVSPGWNRLRDMQIFEESVKNHRLKMIATDLTKAIEPGVAQEIGMFTHVLHLGAMSHVNTAMKDPTGAILDNVFGTQNLIEFARGMPMLQMFLYFSTDEVFGPAPHGINFKEGDRFNPSNQYAATKGAAELLCMAAANTYKMPFVITNTMNVFGERQHPEKFIPMAIRKLRKGEVMQIHGDAQGNSGSRYWIHARNVADALLFIANQEERLTTADPTKGRFNIVGEREITTLDLYKLIASNMGIEPKFEVVNADAERPGHDFRYALDGSKMASLGWKHPKSLEEALSKTLAWMTSPEHEGWIHI